MIFLLSLLVNFACNIPNITNFNDIGSCVIIITLTYKYSDYLPKTKFNSFIIYKFKDCKT